MTRVLGIGGVFFKCADPAATSSWYARVLGMQAQEWGGFILPFSAATEAKGDAAAGVFAPFPDDTDYFAPSDSPVMVNLMVDDLDGVLARAAAEGVAEVKPREESDFGRFGWIMDPDGRKLELWQPPG